jgi:hypothetical protein
MEACSWTHRLTDNDVKESSLPLAKAKAYLPEGSLVSGTTPDPTSPPPGVEPISIMWGNTGPTDEYVSADKLRVARRTKPVGDFYARIGARVGSQENRWIVITALDVGRFLITPLRETK